MTANEDIFTLRSREIWGVSPKWSPDGTKIAVGINTNSIVKTGKYEVVVLNQNGVQLFTTNLSKLPGQEAYIAALSWSPDGDRIAFWYKTNGDTNQDLRLAVYDTKQQKTKDLCVTKNAENHMWHRNDVSPIWSPDGKFLLIETANTNDNNPNVVIVDLVQEEAVIVKTGYEPVGWMK